MRPQWWLGVYLVAAVLGMVAGLAFGSILSEYLGWYIEPVPNQSGQAGSP